MPDGWRPAFADARVERKSIGVSRADVARVRRIGQPDVFLKSEVVDAFSELDDEITRLQWLRAQDQAAPTVIATAEEEGRRWLLMSALPGRDLASAPELHPSQVVVVLADALMHAHAGTVLAGGVALVLALLTACRFTTHHAAAPRASPAHSAAAGSTAPNACRRPRPRPSTSPPSTLTRPSAWKRRSRN